ncbi:hypothetical protein [Paenibacillus odorifer]|uniref:hypothetical protein n=1 Tax=Paenibacillus odorifer TaxID=189426 RepID=UPI00096E4BB0|nr:hypothetical protein [Paenibacillus odorifer]OME41444.1 hypothetical protein BSK58_15040 [Paenibacillus odorifer]
MPLFVVNKIPLTLTWETDRMLREEIYGVGNVMKSYIVKSNDKNNTSRLQKKLLHKKYREDPATFIDRFVKFDLCGEEACENLWDILYDYCAYYGSGYPSDHRDIEEQLFDEYNGSQFIYPQGKKFYLDYYAPSLSLKGKFLRHKKGKIIRTLIDTRNVVRVVGTIDKFLIIFNDRMIRCSDTFEVILIKG